MARPTRQRFEAAQRAYREASLVEDELEIALGAKYGRRDVQWASTAEKRKLEQIRNRRDSACDRVFKMVRGAPRDWGIGVPVHWVCGSLSYDDAFRPAGEPLSVTPPLAYGATEPMRGNYQNPHPLAGAGDWQPASGGTEQPFTTRTGRRLQYVWQPRTGAHAYYDVDRDVILSDEEAQRALGFALLANQRRSKRRGKKRIVRGFSQYYKSLGLGKELPGKKLRRGSVRALLNLPRADNPVQVTMGGGMQIRDNQVPAPNVLGYAVLAAFSAAALYAIFRPRRAEASAPAPTAPVLECPLETTEDFARLEAWATSKSIAVVYLPATTEPPSPERSEIARAFVLSSADEVVITSDGRFWTYESGQPVESSTYLQDFCNFKPAAAVSGVRWL